MKFLYILLILVLYSFKGFAAESRRKESKNQRRVRFNIQEAGKLTYPGEDEKGSMCLSPTTPPTKTTPYTAEDVPSGIPITSINPGSGIVLEINGE